MPAGRRPRCAAPQTASASPTRDGRTISAIVLADRPDALHVRLDGPVEKRVAQAVARTGKPEAEIRRALRSNDAARAAYGSQPGRSARPVPCRPTVRRADAPARSSDEPVVFGLRTHRIDFIRRHNDRSPEREE